MKAISAAVMLAAALCPAAAVADSRVFIIANPADGYGVDRCLARGERCGSTVASSYCRSHDFAEAVSYRRIDPEEITGSVPRDDRLCIRGDCSESIAITCRR